MSEELCRGNCVDCIKRKNSSYYTDTRTAFQEWKAAKKEFGLDSKQEIEAWNKVTGKRSSNRVRTSARSSVSFFA